jgi:peptidoglycan/xylan/chitin deacetylase (PgdA/CDA1 family)
LGYLEEHDWRVIDVEIFLRGLTEPGSLPERAVLLTFDDGYRSMCQTVLPWLLRYGYPAVVFVPTDFIGATNSFDLGVEPEEPICDWDNLRELERGGVSVQSHGVSHHWFSRLDLPQQIEELHRSKAVLEAGLGKRVELFAFPYSDGGQDSGAVETALQQAGYRAAFFCGGGPNANCLPIVEPYRLSRLSMYPDTDLQAKLWHSGANLPNATS